MGFFCLSTHYNTLFSYWVSHSILLIRILLAKYLNNHLSSAFRHTFYVTHTLPLLWPLERQSYISLHTSSSFFFTHPLALPYGYIGKIYSLCDFAGKPNHQQNNTTNKLYLMRKKAYKFIRKTYIFFYLFL